MTPLLDEKTAAGTVRTEGNEIDMTINFNR